MSNYCHHHTCSCHHHEHHSHSHSHAHEAHPRARIVKLLLSALALIAAYLFTRAYPLTTTQQLLVYLPAYLIAGYETLLKALVGIAHGDVWDEHFLMSVATLGALAIGFMPEGEPEFVEAVCVMLFFQLGEMFEEYAEGQSRRSISHLLAIRPDVAHVRRNDVLESVAPEEIALGETIIVKPGERVPLDGVITEGTTSLDTSALTGESMPRSAHVGDSVAAGCVNLTGVIAVRTTHLASESTTARMLRIVEQSAEKKSRRETFISRFARIYTPIVVFAAIAVATLPPLFLPDATFTTWLHRALIFLVVSCPCALVISVPLTFFAGIGGASRKGILIKGATYIDALAQTHIVCFDKTGTLTKGKFTVVAVHPDKLSADQLLHLAAHVERHSTHPLAAALREAFPNESTDGCQVSEIIETSGNGITATVNDQHVSVGNDKMMNKLGVSFKPCHLEGTIVHVAIDGKYAGHIVVGDELKPSTAQAVSNLHHLGVQHVAMLTGDLSATAAAIARKANIDKYQAELSPEEKVAYIDQQIQKLNPSQTLAFVGDGINDTPALARAHIGIAMGALGSDAAIETADVVVMDDNPLKVPLAISTSQRTIAIARQNIAFAIGIKVLVLLLATFGLATMWMAVFADVGTTVLAVLNAMRAYHTT